MYNKVTFRHLRWRSASFSLRTARVALRAVDLEFGVDRIALDACLSEHFSLTLSVITEGTFRVHSTVIP